VTKKLDPPDRPEFAGRLFARIQALRAAAPPLRSGLVAPQLRLLTRQLAEADELGIQPPAELAQVVPLLGAWLEQPTDPGQHELADRLGAICYPLRHALRRPRTELLIEQMANLRAGLRVRGRPEALARVDRLRGRLADPDVDLTAAADDLAALEAELFPDEVEEEAALAPGHMRFHPRFSEFSEQDLGMVPEALLRARRLVRLFNLSGGRRDRKKLRTGSAPLFELRHRTAQHGGIRVFYRQEADGWVALAAMSKYDDRQQRDAIERVLGSFPPPESRSGAP
jgi:hypothetical protein